MMAAWRGDPVMGGIPQWLPDTLLPSVLLPPLSTPEGLPSQNEYPTLRPSFWYSGPLMLDGVTKSYLIHSVFINSGKFDIVLVNVFLLPHHYKLSLASCINT